MNLAGKNVEKIDTQSVVIEVPLYHEENADVVATSVSYLKIIPSKKGNDWKTLFVQRGGDVEPNSITYNFSNSVDNDHERALRPFQKSLIIIDLPPFEGKDYWRFHDKGIIFVNEFKHCRVRTELTNQDQRLILSIDQVGETDDDCEQLAFRYVASCIDFTKDRAGKLKVYYSQDPILAVRRPK